MRLVDCAHCKATGKVEDIKVSAIIESNKDVATMELAKVLEVKKPSRSRRKK
jgi:hypothetical protein